MVRSTPCVYALRLRAASTKKLSVSPPPLSKAAPSEPHPGPKHKERPSIRRVPFARSVRSARSRVAFASRASPWLTACSERHPHDTCKQMQSQRARERGGSDGSQCVAIADSPAAKVVAPPYSQRRLVSDHAESSMTAPPESAKPLCIAHHHLSRAQAVRSSQSARQWRRTA